MSDDITHQIYADIGHLKGQMDNALAQLEKISDVVSSVAVHEEKINNIRLDVKSHQDWIDGSKRHFYFWSGGTIGGAGIITTIINHFFPGDV